jgi:large subunit ribosomal protein L35
MPKMKTSRATAKRFKRTASGKIKRGKAYSRHHLQLKRRKRKRRLHAPGYTESTERRHMAKLLPYGS